MKKILFSAALLFTVCSMSAQESVVKEAKSAKSDPVKAAEILEPALVDPSTASDPETCRMDRLTLQNCTAVWLKCSNITQSVMK